jgi:hypothetical protein
MHPHLYSTGHGAIYKFAGLNLQSHLLSIFQQGYSSIVVNDVVVGCGLHNHK